MGDMEKFDAKSKVVVSWLPRFQLKGARRKQRSAETLRSAMCTCADSLLSALCNTWLCAVSSSLWCIWWPRCGTRGTCGSVTISRSLWFFQCYPMWFLQRTVLSREKVWRSTLLTLSISRTVLPVYKFAFWLEVARCIDPKSVSHTRKSSRGTFGTSFVWSLLQCNG